MTIKDCACVIHGDAYNWVYVERLYKMLCNNLSGEIRLHVFTEPGREVPKPFIKHELKEWPGISGPRKSWWYKIQMFDGNHFQGKLLYFDLDVIITQNIDWLWDLDDNYFWGIRDFRYLWRTNRFDLNSSVLLWDTRKFQWIWDDFSSKNINATTKLFHGDQDYLASVLTGKNLAFFDVKKIKSWRWELKDGGLDMQSRLYRKPDTGTLIDNDTCIMVFHGNPKPHQLQDSVIDKYWK